MKKYITAILIFVSLSCIDAQSITGKITNVFNQPLIGASIQWEDEKTGTISDENGDFEIAIKNDNDKVLIFSYLGFKSERITIGDLDYWKVQMIEDNTLSTVNISAKNKATRFVDGVIKVEGIGLRELERAACCSLAGCFNTNASVDAATTNVLTDAKELQILGLSGVYNQVLIDGMPLVIGSSYTYGAASIPGAMIREIFVSKGANSVAQGFESISGQINIMPKSAEKSEKIYLNALINSFGQSQYNVNYLHRKEKWNNFTNVHLTKAGGKVDNDNDGFQDVAKSNLFSLFNKWVYKDPNSKLSAQVGLKYLNNSRVGGQTEYDKKLHEGSNEIYGQAIDINQLDIYTKMNYKLADLTSIIWVSSGLFHNQNSFFGQKNYFANQKYLYSNLVLDHNFGTAKHNWKTGISIRDNRIDESISFIANPFALSYDGDYTNNYTIPGVFTEGIFYVNNFTFMSGLRADHHGEFGWKITPRMLIRAEINENTDLRFTAGKGFRRVHLFSERVNLLASNRDIIITNGIDDNLEPEEAVNIGLNLIQKFQFGDITTSFIVDGYLTYFQNQIFPDYDRSVGKVYIDNFKKESKSKNIQIENKWEISQQFDFKWAYNYQWTAREVEGKLISLPLIPSQKVLAQVSLSTVDNAWQGDLTYKWTGSKRLPNTVDYPSEYQQPENSPSYSQVDFQLTKRWSKFEIYTGIENILDFRQEFPILSSDKPFGRYFDSSFNWGPTKGREFYFGVRYKIPQK
ncbi:MAG: carboxypeptidase-like regulatory domain-containing protein [Saprospiraceae bacterium]